MSTDPWSKVENKSIFQDLCNLIQKVVDKFNQLLFILVWCTYASVALTGLIRNLEKLFMLLEVLKLWAIVLSVSILGVQF